MNNIELAEACLKQARELMGMAGQLLEAAKSSAPVAYMTVREYKVSNRLVAPDDGHTLAHVGNVATRLCKAEGVEYKTSGEKNTRAYPVFILERAFEKSGYVKSV